MNTSYELPNSGSCLQRAPAYWPKQRGCRTGRNPSIRALRLVDVLASAVRRSVRVISRWRRRRAAIRELRALNDHYLRDIGLDRSRIVSTVEEILETGDRPA